MEFLGFTMRPGNLGLDRVGERTLNAPYVDHGRLAESWITMVFLRGCVDRLS